MPQNPTLARLTELCGIQPVYHDVWGRSHVVSDTTRRALLAAMHLAPDADSAELIEQVEARDWCRLLPPVQVLTLSQAPIQITITVQAAWTQRAFQWRLTPETGKGRGGEFRPAQATPVAEREIGGTGYRRYSLELPPLGVTGYHRFELECPQQQDEASAQMTLIITPATCFQPEAVRAERRAWGPTVQLYSLRSQRNWGIGDFGDLQTLVGLTAQAGGGIVGLNPLHALFPDQPQHCSPYSPSSRLFLNLLYIDVEAAASSNDSARTRELIASPRFQARLRRLRAAEQVDYPGVTACKLEALRLSWRDFRGDHLASDSDRARAFAQYRAAQGEALHLHALFEALQAHFRADDETVWGWPAWPQAYRDPKSSDVRQFAEAHSDEVDFRAYLQWLAHEQLAAAGQASWSHGLGIGLYQDIALGVNPGGADTWVQQEVYALGAYAGAPPDEFNLHGQDWGLPPFAPHRLRESAYAPFIDTLRATMSPCGALRIDHAMSLMRLFWVPAGGSAEDGAYVSYPFQDLLGILALESQRNECLVIGEDLGTVPDGLRGALTTAGVLCYRPLIFERVDDGSFKPPGEFPHQALAVVSTHDLPTLRGYWKSFDLDTRAELDLFPTPALHENAVTERALDRARLLIALQHEQLLPPDIGIDPVTVPDITPALSDAVHHYLARTPSCALVVQPEDIFGVIEQTNLPGSTNGHPNWRRKLPLPLDAWADDARWQSITTILRNERGSGVWPRHQPASSPPATTVPRATYRLQFNDEFTLAQATELVPYLADLGISHCYASPYLRARPGSSHGYDIVDHNTINPEIGSAEDFQRFITTLQEHGMGQILDMVPNHMGVMGSDNQWWLSVLENGAASVYADYFDIDWQPLNPELRGKVLLPLLGDHYGAVLSRGELTLVFDATRGEFSVNYYQHRLPVDPAEYPRIVGLHLDRLATTLGPDHERLHELQSLLTAFGHLPPQHETHERQVAERNRDKEVYKRQLAALCEAMPAILQHIEQGLAEFNGRPGEQARRDQLHELIKAQAWRVAYWRVAADDINYRRFFDINDLAALRMENPAVFDDTHRLVLDLIADNTLHGLRIDHPDGLNDPHDYFQRLQASVQNRRNGSLAPVATGQDRGELPLYLVVEKILAEHERMPDDWPIHGATGYRFANLANALFVDPAAQRRMSRIYADFAPHAGDFDDLVYECKKLIMRSALASELNVLANQLARIAGASRYTCDYTLNGLRNALTEVTACFPVYRTYITTERVSADDRRHIDWAVAVAKRRSQAADVGIYDFVRNVLTTDIGADKRPSYRDQVRAFAMKFQQYTAPVMAKGLEDTAFYRYHRLISLNDVGSDPRRFGISVAVFHAATRTRAKHWPHNMLATSTHDSKRAEDVRARINVLSEVPAAWKLTVHRWRRLNRSRKRPLDGLLAPSPSDEYLLYQTLVGTWPLHEPDAEALAEYRTRIEQYMAKAVREAKTHSSWINVNADYEAALSGFIQDLLTPNETNPFLAELATAARRLTHQGLINSLAQTLLKMTSPGVPDIYQGSELWQFHLVDPDNRRPVDYGLRRRHLADLKALLDVEPARWAERLRPLVETPQDGRAKLYLIWRSLSLRRQWPQVFRDGDYRPLKVEGKFADHVCAYGRVLEGKAVVTVVPRLLSKLSDDRAEAALRIDWRDTRVALPDDAGADWHNTLTGGQAACGKDRWVGVGELLADFPVALLVNEFDALGV